MNQSPTPMEDMSMPDIMVPIDFNSGSAFFSINGSNSSMVLATQKVRGKLLIVDFRFSFFDFNSACKYTN